MTELPIPLLGTRSRSPSPRAPPRPHSSPPTSKRVGQLEPPRQLCATRVLSAIHVHPPSPSHACKHAYTPRSAVCVCMCSPSPSPPRRACLISPTPTRQHLLKPTISLTILALPPSCPPRTTTHAPAALPPLDTTWVETRRSATTPVVRLANAPAHHSRPHVHASAYIRRQEVRVCIRDGARGI